MKYNFVDGQKYAKKTTTLEKISYHTVYLLLDSNLVMLSNYVFCIAIIVMYFVLFFSVVVLWLSETVVKSTRIIFIRLEVHVCML